MRVVPLLAFAALLALPASTSSLGVRAWADDPPRPPPPPFVMDGGDEGLDDGSDGPVPFVEEVNKAIDKGVAWLKAKQGPDGSYGLTTPEHPYDPNFKGHLYDYPAGATALALYTLLKCKVPLDDPVVTKGFAWLKAKQRLPTSSYELSMSLLAVTATADPFKKTKASVAAGERVKLTGDWRKWAMDLQALLVKKHVLLGWRYDAGYKTIGGEQDSSSTQLACLALFTADRLGIKAPSSIWADVIQFARAQQEADGPVVDRVVAPHDPSDPSEPPPSSPSAPDKERYAKPPAETPKDKARGFSYIKDDSLPAREGKPTGSMTACDVGTMLMARFLLTTRNPDATWKKQDAAAIQQSIYDGFAWIDRNWSGSLRNSPDYADLYYVYYFYCVERAMDLTGNALLGKHAWYTEMGRDLIAAQKPKGFWDTHSTHLPYDTLDTCFALLFLKRATRGGIPYPTVTGGSDEPPTEGK